MLQCFVPRLSKSMFDFHACTIRYLAKIFLCFVLAFICRAMRGFPHTPADGRAADYERECETAATLCMHCVRPYHEKLREHKWLQYCCRYYLGYTS